MRTETTKYEFAHGKKPKGYGSWWLKLTGTDCQGRYTTEQYNILGKLADAKKQAVRMMKSEIGTVREVVEIEVLP
jgi:hypothetical protein